MKIAVLFSKAVRAAYAEAMRVSGSVVVSGVREDGGAGIYEVFRDGARRYIKDIEPPMLVRVGTKARIK